MNEKLKQLSQKGFQWWKGASWQRKLGLVAMVAIVAGTFVAIVVLSSKTDWRRLVADASPEEVQAIVAQLKKANIPCRVSASGTAVEVDASMIDQARMEIASSGLFGSGVGFELFDRREFGMTSFQERVNYRRALEGELARTIRSLAEVKSARVHLVIPKRALFKEDRKDPSASVVVNLKPGRKLTQKQLQGIRQLVASAVEGLRPGRVTVLDGHGAILARVITDPGQQVANELIEYQRRAERVLEERVLALLEPIVGTGKVVAQVTAEVDYKHVVETNETFDPDSVVIRSEQTTSESSAKILPPSEAKGVAGSKSNLPGGGQARPAAGPGQRQKTSRTVNYEVSKRVLQVQQGSPTLKRVSAAVVVDGSYTREGEGEKAKMVYHPRSEAEMARLNELVKKAIGFDPSRGDQVEVTNLPFNVPAEPLPSGWWTEIDLNHAIQWFVVLVVAILAFLFLVRPVLRRRAGPMETEIILEGGRPATVVELEQRLQQALPAQSGEQEPAGAEGKRVGEGQDGQPSAKDPKHRIIELQQRVREIARRDPERTIQLLRSWLHEEAV